MPRPESQPTPRPKSRLEKLFDDINREDRESEEETVYSRAPRLRKTNTNR